jgi:hypothetical protein
MPKRFSEYAVIKKEGREKGTWLEIGAAWAHSDGKGYGVTLNFIPCSPDAELVIRAIEPKPAATEAPLLAAPRPCFVPILSEWKRGLSEYWRPRLKGQGSITSMA